MLHVTQSGNTTTPDTGGRAIAVIASPPNSPVTMPVWVPWATAIPLAPADSDDSVKVLTVASDVHEPGEPGVKIAVVKSVLSRHPGEQTLVIGAYLDQLDELGVELDAPVIQGSTQTRER